MNYQSAFKQMIEEHGIDVLEDNFLVCSFLLDLVGNSFQDKELINCYLLLNKEERIYHSIQYRNLRDSKDYILPIILRSDEKYTKAQYIKSMEPLLLYMYPNEYNMIDDVKKNNKAGVVKHHSKQVVHPEVVKPNIVYQKPKIQKNIANNPQKFSDISLNIECNIFSIVYSKGKKIKLTDQNGKNVANDISQYVSNDKLAFNLTGQDTNYQLELPKRKYGNINITFKGYSLGISSGNYSDQFKAKELNVLANKGSVDVIADIDKMNINQKDGYSSFVGSNEDLTISSDYGVYCILTGDKQNICNISSDYGDINLSFSGKWIYPKINHLFHKVKRVDNSYRVGNRNVYLDLKTNYGKIKAK